MKYVVTQNKVSVLTWKKSCTVTQTRQGTQVSSQIMTQSTDGSETSSSTTALDFGTTYQVNDVLSGSCKVLQTQGSRELYEETINDQFSLAQDKVIEKIV